MLYDLDTAPVFRQIRIMGRLTFDPNADRHLQAFNILNQGGQFYIGTSPTEPFPADKKARITLHGTKEEGYFAYDKQMEAGNKILANAGKMYFYGAERNSHILRLMSDCGPPWYHSK